MLPLQVRMVLGTRNLFSASTLDQMPHQLVSYLMFGHSQLFTILDIGRTDYMLMLGANPAASNGSLMSAGDVLGRLEAITGRGGKIVLIDPRRTETALYVSEHQFIKPGTDALFLHPDDAAAHGLGNRDQARLVSTKGELVVTVKVTEDTMLGVVSLPHGWGHHRPGMGISTAEASPGISINDLTDEQLVDELSGNAVLNGVPVTLHHC